MSYWDKPRKDPKEGSSLPAFVVSEYEDKSLLMYSHGCFDIMCVYHAIPLGDSSIDSVGKGEKYPLNQGTIEVKEVLGSKTSFSGSVVEYGFVDYSFKAPEDVDYMQKMRDLAEEYGQDRVWRSFCDLYDCIPQERDIRITREMTEKVGEIVSQYPNVDDLRLTLDCLLCAMIAENNRMRKYGSPYDTKLGKKVKALGVYQAVYETNLSIFEVAKYSVKKPWRWISDECRKRGINTPDL